jgi:hypothetical protein
MVKGESKKGTAGSRKPGTKPHLSPFTFSFLPLEKEPEVF